MLTALLLGLGLALSGQLAASTNAAMASRERENAIEQAKVALQERGKAVAQSERARKTFEMLKELLVVAHPEAGHGPDYSMREALDEFVRTLPKRFDGSMPDVEADIKKHYRQHI